MRHIRALVGAHCELSATTRAWQDGHRFGIIVAARGAHVTVRVIDTGALVRAHVCELRGIRPAVAA